MAGGTNHLSEAFYALSKIKITKPVDFTIAATVFLKCSVSVVGGVVVSVGVIGDSVIGVSVVGGGDGSGGGGSGVGAATQRPSQLRKCLRSIQAEEWQAQAIWRVFRWLALLLALGRQGGRGWDCNFPCVPPPAQAASFLVAARIRHTAAAIAVAAAAAFGAAAVGIAVAVDVVRLQLL